MISQGNRTRCFTLICYLLFPGTFFCTLLFLKRKGSTQLYFKLFLLIFFLQKKGLFLCYEYPCSFGLWKILFHSLSVLSGWQNHIQISTSLESSYSWHIAGTQERASLWIFKEISLWSFSFSVLNFFLKWKKGGEGFSVVLSQVKRSC